MSTPTTTAKLLAQLGNGTESDAFEVAKVLSQAKGVNLIASLARVLHSGDRPYSREAAAYALSWHTDRRAAEFLLSCAADPNEHDSVRGQAIEGLAYHLKSTSPKTGWHLKAEELMMQLLNAPSPTLRFWACFGLGSLGSQQAIPRLRKLAREEPDLCPGWWYVREEAEDALEWIAGRPGNDRTAVHLRKAANPAPGAAPNRRPRRQRRIGTLRRGGGR